MNLIDEAENLMLHQFKDSPKLTGLIRELVSPLEEVARNIQELHHGRFIEEAEERRLDLLGNIVGQPRRDMSDGDYKAWIHVGIKLNIGSGTAEDVLGILKIIYGKKPDVLIEEQPPNDLVFRFLSAPKAPLKAVFNIIRSACPVNTKCHFVRAYAETPT